MPHADFGEAGLAVVTLKPDTREFDTARAVAHLKGKLANYKVPKLMIVAETLPRNSMGKVQKKILRETYRAACDKHLACQVQT